MERTTTDLKILKQNLAANASHLRTDLTVDIKAECAHIADPAQCGSIVRRHFNGLVFTLLLLVVIFMAVAAAGIYFHSRR